MPSKFWETAPPGFKARSELEARAKKLAQDEGTAFDQATGGAGFSQPIRPQPSNLSQKLRTGRVLPSQPAQNRPKFQGPTPTPGGSGFTSTRAAQPRIVHEPLQIQEKPLMQAHGFTPPNPLQIAARNVKDTLVGNVTDVGKTVIGSVAASHPEWQPGLKKKGLLPGEEPTLGGTVAGLAGFMGRAYTPDEIAGNPLLALGPEAQIAGDLAMNAAKPALQQITRAVKGYPKALVEAVPRIVPEQTVAALAKKVPKDKAWEQIKLPPNYVGREEQWILEQANPAEYRRAYAPLGGYVVEKKIPVVSKPSPVARAPVPPAAKGGQVARVPGGQGVRASSEKAGLHVSGQAQAPLSKAEGAVGKPNRSVKELQDKLEQQLTEVKQGQIEQAARNPYFEELMLAHLAPKEQEALRQRILARRTELVAQPTAPSVGALPAAESVGAAPDTVAKLHLSPSQKMELNEPLPTPGLPRRSDYYEPQGFTYQVLDNQDKTVGTVYLRLAKDLVQPGITAQIAIEGDAVNRLGVGAVRNVMGQLVEAHPEIRRFVGPRVSGVRGKSPLKSPSSIMAEVPVRALPAAESVGAKGAVPTVPPSQARSPQVAAPVTGPQSLGELIAQNKALALKNEHEFRRTFGTSINPFVKDVVGGFDIVAFDDWLKVPKGVSTSDFLKQKYGDRAEAMIRELIGSPSETKPRISHAQTSTVLSPVSPVTGPRVNTNVKKVMPTRIPDEAPSIEGVGFPEREAPLTVEGAGEVAMPPFGPEAGPPIPKQERVPLWQQAEAGQPPPPVEPPVASQGAAGLPSGRQPGGIQNQQPYNPQDAYQQLQAATAPANLSFKEQLGKVWQAVWSKMADRVDTLKALEQKTGIPAYKLARLVPGATEHGEGIAKRFFDPVTKKVGKDYKHLQDYMILMRNQDLLVRNPSVRLPGGINGWQGTLQAMNALKAKVGAERFAKIEATADELWAVAKKYTIDERVGTFLDNEGATRITSAHPHHIPFKRQGFEDFNRPFTTPEASVSNTGLKKMSIYGSDLPLDEPLAHMRAQIIRTQVYKARNEAAEAVVRGAEKLQELTGEQIVTWIEPKGEMSRITKVTGETFNRAKKAEHSMTRETVSFFKDGKKYTAEIPTIYARAAKSMDKQAVNFWSKVARLSTAPIRYGATSWNPGFLPLNILRDAQGALFKERLIPFSLDYWKGWLSVLKKDEWYWKASDANTFMSGIVDSMKTTDAMSRGRNLGGIQVKNPVDALLVPFRLIEAANLLSERGTRVAVFRKLTAEGVSPLEVAIRTREANVDFSKSGTVMQVINQVIPFSNAALQGTIITAQTIRKNPKQAAAIASLFMVPTILSRVNNMRFETSELIPDYEYTNNWVFQFGEYTDAKTGVKNPLYVKIPKGPIAGPVSFPGEALFNLMRKTDDRSAAQIILESAAEAAKSASPIDPSIAGVMPSVAQTGVGLATNYDLFTGSPIVPQGESNLLPEQQFDENTSKAAVALGQGTHTSPRLIDWAIQNTAGGASEVTSWMVDLGLGALGYNPEVYGGVEPKADVQGLSQTPVVRRFVGTKGTQIERRGWDNLDSATDSTNRTFNALPEVNSLGVRLGQVGDTIERTELTPQQRADYQKLMSEVVTPGVKAVISSDEFKKMAKDKKLETIQKEMASLKEATREQFLRTLPPEQLTPEAQQYLGKQEASRTLKPYFDIKESTFTQYGKRVVPNGKNGTTTLKNFIENTEALIKKARDMTGKELAAAQVEIRVNKASSAWRTFDKLVKKKKLQWRMQHPETGDILWKYHGIKPIGR